MATALYPGAFKPPHKGHFNVVKNLLSGNFYGTEYDFQDYEEKGEELLKGKGGKIDKIDKVVVFIGGGERNGIDEKQSKAVWDIYTKYLPGNVVVLTGEKNPLLAAKNYAKANPDEQFYGVTGVRTYQDIPDLRRVSTYKSRENVKGLAMTNPTDDSNLRASNLRAAILNGDFHDAADFFPDEVDGKDVLRILNMLKTSIIAEAMKDQVEGIFDAWFGEKEAVKENVSGIPIKKNQIMKSEDRNKLVTLYNRIRNQIGDTNYNITFNHNNIKITLKDKGENYGFDYTPYMSSILEYMIDEGMKILPLPEIKIRKDFTESVDFFGKTAYYDPNQKEVVLYVEGRHPKDVMRSFTHEMVHHIQNLEGRLGHIGTTNTNEDDDLLEIEKEAYLTGNITFRNWEDQYKNSSNYKYEGSKYSSPKSFTQVLSEKLYEIKLSRDNAVEVQGDLTGGTFEVGSKLYRYDIKNIPNPYKDKGLFYSIQFSPKGQTNSTPTQDTDPKDYIKILSTMYKIIVDFVEKENPEYIGISSLDNSGSKNYHLVYSSLTDPRNNHIPGYFRKNVKLPFDSPQGKGRFVVLKRRK